MQKVRLGFIGAGFISQLVHLPSFYFDPRVKIVAISDLDKELLKKVSKKYQIQKTYTSHKKMLKDEKLDGIILVTRRDKNESVAKDVINAGISLFSEKPAALSYKSAKKLWNLSKKKKTKYVIGYMKRHDNGILYLKNKIEKNKLGNLLSVYYKAFLGDSYSNPFEYFKHSDKNYRKKNSLNRNFKNKKFVFLKYLNSHCHHINLMRHLFGELKLDYKDLSNKGEGFVFFKTKKNAKIIFNNQFSSSKRWIDDIQMNFEKGSIYAKLPAPLLKNIPTEILIENYENGNVDKPWIPWGWSFRNQANSFVDYIISSKAIKSQCLAKEFIEDIKLIETIFKK